MNYYILIISNIAISGYLALKQSGDISRLLLLALFNILFILNIETIYNHNLNDQVTRFYLASSSIVYLIIGYSLGKKVLSKGLKPTVFPLTYLHVIIIVISLSILSLICAFFEQYIFIIFNTVFAFVVVLRLYQHGKRKPESGDSH